MSIFSGNELIGGSCKNTVECVFLVSLLFGGNDIFLAQLINCSGDPSYGSHPTFSGFRQCAHGVLSDLERRGTFN